MIKALALIAFALSLTAIACRGQVEVIEVPTTVRPLTTAIPESSTPTWQEWLGQQIAAGKCPSAGSTMHFRNEHREPPYRADFYCRTPTPTPDAVATQVAATVAAIPSPRPRRPTTPPTRQPTATPKPRLETSETYHSSVVIPAGESTAVFARDVSSTGYLNFEFRSTHDIRTHQALDIEFRILTASKELAFHAPPITAYRGAIPVRKGETYFLQFSNKHSLFASKAVNVSGFWSSDPTTKYPVIPYYGAEAGSEACRQAEGDLARHRARQAQRDKAIASGLTSAGIELFATGGLSLLGTIGRILPVINSLFPGDEAGMDAATAATISWGCGIE